MSNQFQPILSVSHFIVVNDDIEPDEFLKQSLHLSHAGVVYDRYITATITT